jgi:hypothetical protein
MADKLDGSAIVANTIPGTKIQSGTITTAQLDPAIATAVNTPLHPKISSLSYPGDDLAANTGGGDSIVINGSGFGTNVQVYINNNAVPSLVRNNANAITITTAAQAAGTYLVYLINTDDGGTAILVPGIQYSGTPTWVTTSPLDQQQALSAWSISLSATGDSPIVYTLQAGSSLPDGITLAANGLISGTMTSPPAEDTTYNFTVVATDPELQDTPKAFSVSVTVVVDPQFQYTTLLLQADGTNNGNNHAFLDSSNNNFAITRNGNATQGSFTPFSPTGWSNYFDGNGDYLSLPDNAAFDIGLSGSPFTLECFFYPTTSSTDYQMLFGRGGGFAGWNGTNGWQITFFLYNNLLYLQYWSGSALVTFTVPLNAASIANQWNHLVASYNGTNVSLYANGTRLGTATATFGKPSASNITHIGKSVVSAETYYPTGYISNFRIVKGSAVYDPTQTNLTVPTTTLTSISNTSLLTCQSNRFRDASNNNFTVTRFGDVSVQTFSPFATNIAYSPAVHGGSAYFDGSGDYLTLSGNPTLTTNFTIEFWFYMPSWGDRVFLSQGGGAGSFSTTNGVAFQIYSTSTTFYFQWSNGAGSFAEINTATSGIVPNAWHHVAIGNNGTTTRVWIDGVSVGTNTAVPTWGYPSSRSTYVGYISYSSSYVSLGYMAGVRMVNLDVYGAGNTSITIPTSPPSNIANTSLLCNFTNAQIYDAAAGIILETVGDAKVNTAIKKFGAGSMVFDGTGDWLIGPSNPSASFESGDFTIEGWIYPTVVTGTDRCIWETRSSGSDAGMVFFIDTNAKLSTYTSGAIRTVTSQSVVANTWQHIAICRASGVMTTYVNGVASNTASYSSAITCPGAVRIGVRQDNAQPYTGYIDDLRITKGLARYRYNFTPPTRAFSTKGGTQTLTADEDFEYTTLLLSGNGTNNQNNHTFLDSSNNNFTITRNGNATQGTFSPFSQTGWSNYFDGSGDSLSLADNAAWNMGSGNFTAECWIYPTSFANEAMIMGQWSGDLGGTGLNWALMFSSGSTGYLRLITSSNGSSVLFDLSTSTFTLLLNQWQHIAAVRNGNIFTIYVNGISIASTTNSSSLYDATNSFTIGAESNTPSQYFQGYISNLRVVKGTAVYTANFTPGTTPLTAIANTSLLTCQSNRFVDNSTNNFAITRTGDVSVQAFSPFAPTASYAAANVGGSAYFDGSGDYLAYSNPSTDVRQWWTTDYTLECWVYATTWSGWTYIDGGTLVSPIMFSHNIFNSTTYYWGFGPHSDGKLYFSYWNGSTRQTVASTQTMSLGQWNHIAMTKTSSGVTLFVNGIANATTALVGTPQSDAATPINVGAGNNSYLNGYIHNLRVVKGNAIYSGNFTPPTAPLTNIANTSLLLNFTNAGITDATAKNVLETVGDAKISTVQSKFGGSSIAFDGSGDSVKMLTAPYFQLGASDFTLEFWFYLNSINSSGIDANSPVLFTIGWNWGSFSPLLIAQVSNVLIAYSSSSNSSWDIFSGNTISPTLSASRWYHFAMTRYGSTFRFFIDGNQHTSITNSSAFTSAITNPTTIGSQSSTTQGFMNGYIDDFRFTRGIARYVQNFTPPTTAFLTR